jgi:hypothetical protein
MNETQTETLTIKSPFFFLKVTNCKNEENFIYVGMQQKNKYEIGKHKQSKLDHNLLLKPQFIFSYFLQPSIQNLAPLNKTLKCNNWSV